MTVLIFKDGRFVVDEHQPIEGNLDGLYALIAEPQAGQLLTFNGSVWTSAAPAASVLYAGETTKDSDTVLTVTYAEIAAAIAAGKSVIVRTEAEGTATLVPLASYGGNDDDGYTVVAGESTYTAETAGGALVKQAAISEPPANMS